MAQKQYGSNNENEEQKMLRFVREDLGDEFDNILNKSRDENKFINTIKGFVDKNAKQISTSQLRNVFTKIKNLDENNFKELYTLRPKLAYVSARNESIGMKKLIALLDYQIQKVDDKDKFKLFLSFFESIIAYHKFYGGSN